MSELLSAISACIQFPAAVKILWISECAQGFDYRYLFSNVWGGLVVSVVMLFCYNICLPLLLTACPVACLLGDPT